MHKGNVYTFRNKFGMCSWKNKYLLPEFKTRWNISQRKQNRFLKDNEICLNNKFSVPINEEKSLDHQTKLKVGDLVRVLQSRLRKQEYEKQPNCFIIQVSIQCNLPTFRAYVPKKIDI